MTDDQPLLLNERLARSLVTLGISVDRDDRIALSTTTTTFEAEHKRKAPLVEYLYKTLHSGSEPDAASVPNRRYLDFEQKLLSVLPRTTSQLRGQVCAAGPEEHGAVVEIRGVRVRVPAARLHGDRALTAGDQVRVDIDYARPRLSPGFLLVAASDDALSVGGVIRIYLHVAEAGCAHLVWREVLKRLEALAVPYQAKILSMPEAYPRRDALVVYLRGQYRTEAMALCWELSAVTAHLGTETSVFTREVGPGIAVAWDPDQTAARGSGMSFGQHRAKALAAGIVSWARNGGTGSLDGSVATALREAGIHPEQPYRNSDSAALD